MSISAFKVVCVFSCFETLLGQKCSLPVDSIAVSLSTNISIRRQDPKTYSDTEMRALSTGSNNRSGWCRVNEMEDRFSTKAFVLVLGVLVRALQAPTRTPTNTKQTDSGQWSEDRGHFYFYLAFVWLSLDWLGSPNHLVVRGNFTNMWGYRVFMYKHGQAQL